MAEESVLNEARIEVLKETIESRGNVKAVCESYIDGMATRIERKLSSGPGTLAAYVRRSSCARAQLSASLPKNSSSRSLPAPGDPMSDQPAVLAGAVGCSTKDSESERGEWNCARGERAALGGE